MKIKDFEHLCRKLGLGPLKKSPQPVKGGLLHRMWKIHAGKGVFAVKELDPDIMRKPGIRPEYERSEEFAARTRERGVHTPKALRHKGQFLHNVDSTVAIVYEWIQRKTLPVSKVDLSHAKAIGKLLAQIHGAGMGIGKWKVRPGIALSRIPWMRVVRRLRAVSPSLGTAVAKFEPQLKEWCRRIDGLPPAHRRDIVLSHNDLDSKNVLWQGRTPVVLDWESAGPTEWAEELVGVALDWSGLEQGRTKRELFEEVFKSYHKIGGHSVFDPERALLLCLRPRLNWLYANLRRCFNQDKDPRKLGLSEVSKSLNQLHVLKKDFFGKKGAGRHLILKAIPIDP